MQNTLDSRWTVFTGTNMNVCRCICVTCQPFPIHPLFFVLARCELLLFPSSEINGQATPCSSWLFPYETEEKNTGGTILGSQPHAKPLSSTTLLYLLDKNFQLHILFHQCTDLGLNDFAGQCTWCPGKITCSPSPWTVKFSSKWH